MTRTWRLFLLWRAERRHAALRLGMCRHQIELSRLACKLDTALDRLLALREELHL